MFKQQEKHKLGIKTTCGLFKRRSVCIKPWVLLFQKNSEQKYISEGIML